MRLPIVGLEIAQPVVMAIAVDDEKWVEIRILGVVAQGVAVHIDDLAAGTGDHGMRRRRIPFRCGS